MLYLVTGTNLDEDRWEKEDKPDYAKRAKLTGATTLMTGYVANFQPKGREYERSLGSAMVVSSDGTVLASLPPGKTGILLVDLKNK